MDKLNEEINVVLEQSLDEFIGRPRSKASRWKNYKRAGSVPEKARSAAEEKEKEGKIKALANKPSMQALKGALEGASLVPGVNVPASAALAMINIAEGDYSAAVLSLASMIPFAKIGGKTAKFGPYVVELLKLTQKRPPKNNFQAEQLLLRAADAEDADAAAMNTGDIPEVLSAIKKFINLYKMAKDIDGLGDLAKLAEDHVKPLHDLLKAHKTVSESKIIQEDKLAPIVIDFSQLRKQELNESFLAMFGGWVEHILGAMFGNTSIPVSVRGNRREVESFARTIGSEKNYLESARRHGLDHPMTYKSKAKLDNAIKGFEKDTGLKWPFK